MSRAGNCYDNTMMESLWDKKPLATLKKELVHGSLGYVSPKAFEATEMVG